MFFFLAAVKSQTLVSAEIIFKTTDNGLPKDIPVEIIIKTATNVLIAKKYYDITTDLKKVDYEANGINHLEVDTKFPKDNKINSASLKGSKITITIFPQKKHVTWSFDFDLELKIKPDKGEESYLSYSWSGINLSDRYTSSVTTISN